MRTDGHEEVNGRFLGVCANTVNSYLNSVEVRILNADMLLPVLLADQALQITYC